MDVTPLRMGGVEYHRTSRKELTMSDENASIKPVGLEMARELSAEELMSVGGGRGVVTHSATGKVTSGGDWEASATIDW
ncbi:hypothetical protein XocBAI21_16260 [Xanthomonas oryzae pv. oryzicola]|nr:hypothetical protein XocBAI21_16260 [Xanthomonas oryzae pv. oryzicola]